MLQRISTDVQIVCPASLKRHLCSICATHQTPPEALSLSARVPLLGLRPIRTSDPQKKPLQLAVQYVTSTEGGYRGAMEVTE